MQRSLRILFLQKYVFFLFHQTSNKKKATDVGSLSLNPFVLLQFSRRRDSFSFAGKSISLPRDILYRYGVTLPLLFQFKLYAKYSFFHKVCFHPKTCQARKNCVKKHPNFFPETFPKWPFCIGTGAISNLSAANFRHSAANRREDGRSRHGDGRSCDYDRPNQ